MLGFSYIENFFSLVVNKYLKIVKNLHCKGKTCRFSVFKILCYRQHKSLLLYTIVLPGHAIQSIDTGWS